VFLVGYGFFGLVLRQNAYLSRTIQVEKGQTVVDTGLYGIVRHPMYTATLLMFLSMPLILGSWQAFLVFLTYPVLIVKRIRNEDAVLTRELQGYKAYYRKVCYRLIPYIW
jgi:protein-S-isoprenylcysteine O-methyltransferase Ste14